MNSQGIQDNLPFYTNSYGFHLIFFSNLNEMHELWLPKIPEGYFRFTDHPKYQFLNIIAQDGKWVAVCKKLAFFKNVSLDQSYSVILQNGQLLTIEYNGIEYSLYVEEISHTRMSFKNYHFRSDVEISIGNHSRNDIFYNNIYASEQHAIMCYSNNQWDIRDCNSVYGIFVNNQRVDQAKLNLGDIVNIMGLRIIVGPGFLSVNEGSCKIAINQVVLKTETIHHSGYSNYYGQEPIGSTSSSDFFFNRLPRKRLEITPKTISVEGPPMSMNQKNMPLILRMGSSLAMGTASALAGNFMTLISSVMFPFLSTKYSEKERQEYEQLRTKKYREYLISKSNEIEETCAEERKLLNKKFPSTHDAICIVKQHSHLWERRPIDDDFLQIRLGTGTQKLISTIDYPARHFELVSDELEEEMYKLVEVPHNVENVPITLSLADTHVCGIVGQRDRVINYIRQLVLQIATFHSYDEVKMIFLLNGEELNCLDDIRYLPHVWDDQRTLRFIATNEAEAYKLGDYVKEQFSLNNENSIQVNQSFKKSPYYIVFALDKKAFESHEIFKEILQPDGENNISIITAYGDLLKESQKIITLELNTKNIITTMSANGGEDISFSIDDCNEHIVKDAMRILSNTRLKTITEAQEIPKMLTFLEMFKAGRIEQLNPLKRWKENNPVKSLATPVGIGVDGLPFMLDLHEKYQGPHGLIAGTTGSGKSEFIITYILSMAVNYHPDEVAFVLIDYKGGGLTGAFENPQTGLRLPHLVGTITNLDGPSINRSLMSIKSELIRRQKIFNEVKNIVNEGTMDIYSYQKLYRAKVVSEPLPHLFIISDEFAELKQQQPEFMDELMSIARIGRSLGIHLILATQKPSGVVNDQIRSNTKFRVCLRVQDKADSMDMLKRPEAVELTDAGRFYLQVGYNEYFALGQSAWCGAAYEPQDTVTIQRDDSIEFLDTMGQVITKAKPSVKKIDSGMKQIVAVVKYLSELAATHNIQPRQLWVPELPVKLELEDILLKQQTDIIPMSICLGLVDDPENQDQFPYYLDFESCSNILIAGRQGSGKTTIVQNIIYSLANILKPEDVNFYVLDYSSRMLKVFSALPHFGAVLYEEDSVLLDEFFKLVNGIVSDRKRLFSELEVDSFEQARKLTPLPLILVIIDNIAGLSSSKIGENHNYNLMNYLKNSANYGVKYIITCNHLNEISSRVRQELSERICLQLKDKFEYSDALFCKISYIPPDFEGRGLCKIEGRPLEFQGAMLFAHQDERKQINTLKENVNRIAAIYGEKNTVRKIAITDNKAEYHEFAAQFNGGRIPLGYSKITGKPIALPLKQLSSLSLYFGNLKGKHTIVKNILHALYREGTEIWVAKQNSNSILDLQNELDNRYLTKMDSVTCSTEDLRLLQSALMSTILERNTITDDAMNIDVDNVKIQFPPIVLIIENFADFFSGLSSVAVLSYAQLFSQMKESNMFVVCCFEPNLPENMNTNSLFSYFADHEILLFGGGFEKQSLCREVQKGDILNEMYFNEALMKYRNQIHPLIMPCGKIEQIKEDNDLKNIFDV